MARKISVSVDHNLCVGNQMCISIATKALTLNDDRQAIPADVDGDTEEIILEAAEQCPMAAISVMDHNLCVGNQMCISIATKALTLNDDRQAIPADVDGDTEEIILEAAEQCPMAAISVMDAETGEQLFP